MRHHCLHSHWTDLGGPHRRYPGFTLIEILIVVVILGILAAIVIPQFTTAADDSRLSAMTMTLRRVREQLEVYQVHHQGRYPTEAATFLAQMTRGSRVDGQTGAAHTKAFPHGPYLRKVPINPYTGGGAIGEGEVGSSDWYYADGEFHPNDTADHRAY